MTQEIKARQAAEESTGAVESGQRADTRGARNGAERKPMVSWAALLDEAVKKPGFIHEAYSRFHNYSLGNQLLGLFQCLEHGIQPGPLATCPKWKELGRHVKKACQTQLWVQSFGAARPFPDSMDGIFPVSRHGFCDEARSGRRHPALRLFGNVVCIQTTRMPDCCTSAAVSSGLARA